MNAVVVELDGTLTGFNNGRNGFIQSLRDADPAWRPAFRAWFGVTPEIIPVLQKTITATF